MEKVNTRVPRAELRECWDKCERGYIPARLAIVDNGRATKEMRVRQMTGRDWQSNEVL